MKFRFLLTLLLVFLLSGVAKAQYAGGNICNHLLSTGRVSIIQDNRLTELLGSQPKAYYVNGAQPDKATKVKGFRIRVFSGNQQNTSKNKAYKIQTELTTKMPELSTYVTFKTPNWRLMVGDYRTTEEANSMLRVLRKEFPNYGKDMFVVSEEIEL